MRVFGFPLREGRMVKELGTCQLEVEVERQPFGTMIVGSVKGKPKRLEVCRVSLNGKILFLNNWQSWGLARVMRLSQLRSLPLEKFARFGYSAHPLPELLRKHPVSDYFVFAGDKLLGFLTSAVGHPFFSVEGREIVGYIEYFDREFESFVPLEKLVIVEGRSLEKSLELYADLVSIENDPGFSRWNPVGWCSWYHYYDKLAWEDVKKNINLAKEMGMGYEVFQIDDSWQEDIGDWKPKGSFPNFEEMAETVASESFVPGLWLAPFSVSGTSSLVAKHPEWLVKDDDGVPVIACRNWGKTIYALDTSHPDVLQWLRNLFTGLKKAGFRYFKIDFLFAGAVPGNRYRHVTPVEAYRMGMKAIRDSLEECFILGCGAPLLPSVGYVDGMRVGPDTAPVYKVELEKHFELNAYNALKSSVMRYFTHGRWWWNDPDCLLLRREQTEMDDDARRIYALVSGALDNMLVESDNLEASVDKELWHEALSLRGGAVEVRGLASSEIVIKVYGTGRGDVELTCDLEEKKVRVRTMSVPLRKQIREREDGRLFHYYKRTE